MKRYCFLLILLLAASAVFGQHRRRKASDAVVGGVVVSADGPVSSATVQLLSARDSVMRAGGVTDDVGRFSIGVRHGRYIVRVSYVGCKTYFSDAMRLDGRCDLGTVRLKFDTKLLEEAVVTAEAPMVTSENDTVTFHAAAFKTSRGAKLKELVGKLPGAVLDGNSVKINGRTIEKLLVDGKEFFGGDLASGLNHLPADVVEKLRSYEKESDMKRITGVDDGEEELVLDVRTKKKFRGSAFSNIDGGYGSRGRYVFSGTSNFFDSHKNFSVYFNQNNVGDEDFADASIYRNNSGYNTNRMAGGNIHKQTERLTVNGNVYYSYIRLRSDSESETERFFGNGSSMSMANSNSLSRHSNLNSSFRIEWKIDSLTTLMLRPSFYRNSQRDSGEDVAETFDGDDDMPLNSSKSVNLSDGDRTDVKLRIMLNRRLNSVGRNIMLRASGNVGRVASERFSDSHVAYRTEAENDSRIRRHVSSPVHRRGASVQTMYSEPVGRKMYLQIGYRFSYDFNRGERSAYDFSGLDWSPGDGLPENFTDYFDASLSKSAEYHDFCHRFSLGFKLSRRKLRMNVSVNVMPQRTRFTYRKGDYDVDISKSLVNYSPMVRLDYRPSKDMAASFNYYGYSSRPSMENLLPVRDDSNPLLTVCGNPDLKPSFTHFIRGSYRSYDRRRARSHSLYLSGWVMRNSVVRSTSYDALTGRRESHPVNMDGDFNLDGSYSFNTALRNRKFNVSSTSGGGFSQRGAMLFDGESKSESKNRLRSLTLSEQLRASFRNDAVELAVFAGGRVVFEREKLRSRLDRTPKYFNYGASADLKLPCGFSLSTKLFDFSRRGTGESEDERDEIVWNAQFSKSFMREKASASLELFDILRERSCVTRRVTADYRRMTRSAAVNTYCMFHLRMQL